MTEFQPNKAPRRRGLVATGAMLAGTALLGVGLTGVLEGCSAADKAAGTVAHSFHDHYTFSADPNSPTTKAIESYYDSARHGEVVDSTITMHYNRQDDGSSNYNSSMTWALGNGEQCSIASNTPEFDNDTSTLFVGGSLSLARATCAAAATTSSQQ